MEGVSSTLALHHHLAASGREEVSSLIVRRYLELLNTFERRGDCTPSANPVVRVVVVAFKVARDVPAVQHVSILIAHRPSYLATVDVTTANRRRRGWLERKKRRCVTIQVGHGKQHVIGHCAAH